MDTHLIFAFILIPGSILSIHLPPAQDTWCAGSENILGGTSFKTSISKRIIIFSYTLWGHNFLDWAWISVYSGDIFLPSSFSSWSYLAPLWKVWSHFPFLIFCEWLIFLPGIFGRRDLYEPQIPWWYAWMDPFKIQHAGRAIFHFGLEGPVSWLKNIFLNYWKWSLFLWVTSSVGYETSRIYHLI